MELATSVSTTSLAVSFGGEVHVTLVIDETNELFGFLRRSRIDVTQQAIDREGTRSDQIGWLFGGL
jgi:hypothetical protein